MQALSNKPANKPPTAPKTPAPILCITPDPPNMFGASRSLRTLLDGFDRMQLNIQIAVFTRGALARQLEHRRCDELIDEGERTWFTGKYKITKALRLAYEVLLLLWRVRKLIKTSRARLIYVNTMEFGTPILGSRLAGMPCVVHFRESEEYAYPRDHVARIRLWAIRRAKPRCIVVSQAAGKTARRLGIPPERIKVVHNAVDTTYFQPRLSLERHASLTVVCVTRISAEKGVDDLLLAARRVIKHLPQVRFVLVGGPTDSKYFHDVIKPLHREASLGTKWTFAGLLQDPRDEMERADVVVVPSRQETFGRVNIEAMAMGKPVVATDAGGIPEVVQHGVTGLVVPVGQPDLLADGIIELLKNPSRRAAMGRAARDVAVRDFSLEKHAASVAALLDDAAGGRW